MPATSDTAAPGAPAAPAPAPLPSPASGVGAVPGSRVAWADIAKGACILLVVAHHLIVKHLPDALPADAPAAILDWWATADAFLKPLRMPLFFMLSGLFAAGAIRRPWAAVWERKVLTPYWVYLTWLVIHVAVFTVVTRIATTRIESVAEFAAQLLVAAAGVWYLYGLAVYFVATKLLARIPAAVTLTVAAAVSASASYLPVPGVNRVQLLQCFVFFAAGAYLPHLLTRMRPLPLVRVAPLVVGYATVGAVAAAVGLRLSVTMLLLAPVAVVVGAQLAMRVDVGGPAGRGLARLGRQTLPVYVLHMPLLGLLHEAVTSGPGQRLVTHAWPELVTTSVAVLYPVLAIGALVTGSLLTHRLLLRCGLRFLFAPPTGLAGVARTVVRTVARVGARGAKPTEPATAGT